MHLWVVSYSVHTPNSEIRWTLYVPPGGFSSSGEACCPRAPLLLPSHPRTRICVSPATSFKASTDETPSHVWGTLIKLMLPFLPKHIPTMGELLRLWRHCAGRITKQTLFVASLHPSNAVLCKAPQWTLLLPGTWVTIFCIFKTHIEWTKTSPPLNPNSH